MALPSGAAAPAPDCERPPECPVSGIGRDDPGHVRTAGLIMCHQQRELPPAGCPQLRARRSRQSSPKRKCGSHPRFRWAGARQSSRCGLPQRSDRCVPAGGVARLLLQTSSPPERSWSAGGGNRTDGAQGHASTQAVNLAACRYEAHRQNHDVSVSAAPEANYNSIMPRRLQPANGYSTGRGADGVVDARPARSSCLRVIHCNVAGYSSGNKMSHYNFLELGVHVP